MRETIISVGEYGKDIVRVRTGFTGTITASDVFLRDPAGNILTAATFPGPRSGDLDLRLAFGTFDEPGTWEICVVIYSGSVVLRTPTLRFRVDP